MKLTHHTFASRSFVSLVIIVLAMIYTALFLVRLQNIYIPDEPVVAHHKTQAESIDTADWKIYQDQKVPVSFLAPKTWKITTDTKAVPGMYIINIATTKSSGPIKIFVSTDSFAGVTDLKGNPLKVTQNLTVTNYDDLIFTVKAGEYYYTFDGTMSDDHKAELAEIVRSARFE